jgi:hypothetical protein
MKKPKKPPPKDSLEKLAKFTKKILQVPRSALPNKRDSDGTKTTDEQCPET